MELEDSLEEEESLYVDSEDEVLHFSDEGAGCGAQTVDRDFGIASCQTLTPDMISKKMFAIIKEVNDVFQVRSVARSANECCETCPSAHVFSVPDPLPKRRGIKGQGGLV